MKPARFVALALALLVGGSLGVAAADHGVVESTSAAWSDRAHVAATVTAGTWKTTTSSTCLAYGPNGQTLAGCTVLGTSRYDGWGEPGKQTRNYYLNFSLPPGTSTYSFDVDLTTVAGTGSWSWKTAKVVRDGAQFTPRGGWTCAELPRVRGTGPSWYTQTIYFQVVESDNGSATMCS